MIVLLTGQPCSGKSTISKGILKLYFEKYLTIFSILDGDELRKIFKDEGFGIADRIHNVSRAFDIALYCDAYKINTICSLVMPFKWQRDALKDKAKVVEIYLHYDHLNNPRGRESYHVSYYEQPTGNDYLDLDTTLLSEKEAIEKAFEYIETFYHNK